MTGRRPFAFALLAAATAASAQADPKAKEKAAANARAAPEPADDAIVVQGQKPPVKRTVEGTTHDVRENAQGQAGSAAEVLNTVPSVNVSPDGGVTVRGDSNVQVYVNGRPAAGGGASLLQSMSGSSIASVEVITNPSARFDANGGAILNVVLKKGAGQGLRGTVTANAGDRGRKNTALNASYGGGKVSASISASLRDDVRLTEVDDERLIFAPSGSLESRFVTESRYTPTHARSAGLNASAAYALDPEADLGVDMRLSVGSPRNTVFERHVDGGPDGAESEYRRVRGGSYVSDNLDLTLYLDRRGGANRPGLKLVGQHSASTLRSDRLFTTFYDVPQRAPTAERIFNGSATSFDRAAADYETPVGAKLRVSAGAEWRRERNRLDNGRAAFEPGTPPPAPALTAFEAFQRSAAAYGTLQFRSGPWTLQAGQRFEDLAISTTLVPEGFESERHLGGFNHSLSGSYDIGDDQLILRLSRTRQRFELRDLNPSLVYIDAQNVRAGNPFLLPQIVTSAEGEYAFSRGGHEGAAILYYRRTDDTIADFYEFAADNVLVTTKRNGGRSQSFGAQFTLSGKLGAALKYSLTGNLFRAQLAGPGGEGIQPQSRVSYAAQASLDWSVTPKDQLRADANIQGPSLVPQGVRTGTGAVNLVWRHALSPRLTLSLTAQGVVLDNRVLTVTKTPRAININDRLSGGRAILAGIAWKIR